MYMNLPNNPEAEMAMRRRGSTTHKQNKNQATTKKKIWKGDTSQRRDRGGGAVLGLRVFTVGGHKPLMFWKNAWAHGC
jgi:hypothetical protein